MSAAARAGRARAEARGDREGQGGRRRLHLQDQMIAARAALLAALLARQPGRARPTGDASDVAPPLARGVMAYRAGDLATAGGNAAPARAGQCRCRGLARRGAARSRRRTARPCRRCSTPPTRARPKARIGWRWSMPRAWPARRATMPVRSSCSRRPRRRPPPRADQCSACSIFRGQGVPRDLVQARAWLEKAAASNDPYALYALGRAMDETLGAGRGRSGARRRSLSTRGASSAIRWRRCATAWR